MRNAANLTLNLWGWGKYERGQGGVHQVDPEVGAGGVVLPPRVEHGGAQLLPRRTILNCYNKMSMASYVNFI
jgi:hypothetical protein